MQPVITNCGLTIDSATVYNIAENKRQAIDCFQDGLIKDSIIAQQQQIIATQARQTAQLQLENTALQTTATQTTRQLAAEKPKKWRWGAVGITFGVLLGFLIK